MKISIFALKHLVNFKITLPLAKLDMVSSRLVSNGVIFSGDTIVDILLVSYLLLASVSELSVGARTKKH